MLCAFSAETKTTTSSLHDLLFFLFLFLSLFFPLVASTNGKISKCLLLFLLDFLDPILCPIQLSFYSPERLGEKNLLDREVLVKGKCRENMTFPVQPPFFSFFLKVVCTGNVIFALHRTITSLSSKFSFPHLFNWSSSSSEKLGFFRLIAILFLLLL